MREIESCAIALGKSINRVIVIVADFRQELSAIALCVTVSALRSVNRHLAPVADSRQGL
jgi:hypothetical protein